MDGTGAHSSSRPDVRPRVALVFGGRSSEHSISCVSAGSVLSAIDRARWDVVPIGITADGRWVLAPDDPDRLAIVNGALPVVDGSRPRVLLSGDPTSRSLLIAEAGEALRDLGPIDVVFPLLHGPYGEDGTIQGLLELSGIPYVGSGVFASAAAMDKGHMKAMFSAAGLPVGPYRVLPGSAGTRADSGEESRSGFPPDALAAVVEDLDFPVFVKPCRAGSSLGISKVRDREHLAGAIAEASRHDPRVIVEAGISGREIECGVLEGVAGAAAEASVPAEIRIVGDHEFYDFDAKYLDGATELTVPAEIPPGVADEVRRLSVRAYEALSCEGLARVDFFLRPDGSLLVNEVNTMPGFTPYSMFPRMWAATGLGYPALVDRLLRTACARRSGLR